MKFREGNYALYYEGDNTELCRIIKVCGTDTYKVVFDEDGKLLLTQHIKPVPITESDIDRIGYSFYFQADNYTRYSTGDDGNETLTLMKGEWLYRKFDVTMYLSVRYLHEVQNLMDVLNDL